MKKLSWMAGIALTAALVALPVLAQDAAKKAPPKPAPQTSETTTNSKTAGYPAERFPWVTLIVSTARRGKRDARWNGTDRQVDATHADTVRVVRQGE